MSESYILTNPDGVTQSTVVTKPEVPENECKDYI